MRLKIILLLLADYVCSSPIHPQFRRPFLSSDQRTLSGLALQADENPGKRSHAKLLQAQGRQTVKKNLLKRGYLPRYLLPPDPSAVSHYELWNHGPPRYYYPRSKPQVDKIIHNGIPRNHRPFMTMDVKQAEDDVKARGSNYIRDHAPIVTRHQNGSVAEAASENKSEIEEKPVRKKLPENLELSKDGDRVEFQIQGHEGPKTYIFGFDTGDGKNRQFRLEERLKDGTVKGHYGYYDARGKLRTIRYLARPFEGYREKHHVSNSSSE